MFDPKTYKPDFPILQRKIHGEKRLVYLDNAATSQKPVQVIEAISNYYLQHNANVHRGIHQLGDESTHIFHDSRKKIAEFFGADAAEFVAVRNTTEAINQVAYTWGESAIHANDVILVTEMEHHSNLVPWQELVHRKQAKLTFLDVDQNGQIDLAQLEKILTEESVKLIALTHVSNALGTVNPVEEIITLNSKLAAKTGKPKAKILIDGAQSASHLPINFHELGADFYVVSAHKMLGPMGIGGLFVKKELLSELPPFLFGGGMINEVTKEKTTFAEDLEERFTAGTPDVAGLVGWAAACEYLQNIGMAELAKHDQELVEYTLEKLKEFPQVQVVGPAVINEEGSQKNQSKKAKRVGSVAFLYKGVHAHDVGQILDSEGVAVRSGHHCTMPLHTKFGWPATVRVSFQLYNSKEDIDVFIEALKKVAKVFGK